MNTYAFKIKENTSQSIANRANKKQNRDESFFQFVDNRPEVITQIKLQKLTNNSPRAMQFKAFQNIANHNPQVGQAVQFKAIANDSSSSRQSPIQLKHFKTNETKNRQGLAGHVSVKTAGTSIDLEGKLIGGEGAGISAKGKVYMPEYKVNNNRLNPPERIREQEGNTLQNFWNPSDALRVQNLSAEPKGLKLGQILTYYHGYEAKKRGKPYVIAMKVSDARGPFYTPLGFLDYNGSKPWKDLNAQHNDLEATLRKEADNMSNGEILNHQKRMAALKNEMENSSMIINSDDLIANSQEKFAPVWEED